MLHRLYFVLESAFGIRTSLHSSGIQVLSLAQVWHRLNFFKNLKRHWNHRRQLSAGFYSPHTTTGLSDRRSDDASPSKNCELELPVPDLEMPLLPPKVAVLGCMAGRLKQRLLETDKLVDIVCGPDAYRDLPRLLQEVCGF